MRELRRAGYGAEGLRAACFTVAEVRSAGYGCREAEQAGWSAHDGELGGYPCCFGRDDQWHYWGDNCLYCRDIPLT